MLDFWLLDDDCDAGLAATHITSPICVSEGSKPLRDGFVEAVGTYINGMLDAIQVRAGDSAGSECMARWKHIRHFFAIGS